MSTEKAVSVYEQGLRSVKAAYLAKRATGELRPSDKALKVLDIMLDVAKNSYREGFKDGAASAGIPVDVEKDTSPVAADGASVT